MDSTDTPKIEFKSIASYKNFEALTQKFGGSWDGNILAIDHPYFNIQVHYFQFLNDIHIDLCTMETFHQVNFIQAPPKDQQYVYVRVGFSGLIVDLGKENEFENHGVFIYSSNQHFEIEYPPGIKSRWIVIKFPVHMGSAFTKRQQFEFKKRIEDPNPWIYYFPLDAEIEAYVKQIFDHGTRSEGRHVVPFSKALDIMGVIKEKFDQEDHGHADHRIHPEDLKTVIIIKNQILSNMNTAPRLEDLSLEHGISVSKLNRLFKNVFKLPLLKFYNTRKIEKVHQKILHSPDSLTQIAEEMGFAHMAHMSRVFKKHYGFPPSDLRKLSLS